MTAQALPPGPPLPRWVQTAGFMFGPLRYLEWAHRRYGDVVTLRTLFQDEPFVMVFDPALAKGVFQASGDELHAGEANAILGPIVGERSVLLLDGGEHLRHRRLLSPPFHGRALATYEQAILDATDAQIDSWPVGGPFPLLPSMQGLTLQVIMEVVFGYAPGEATELAARLRAFIDPFAEPRTISSVMRLLRTRIGDGGGAEGFLARRRAVDELLFAEIESRRALGDEALASRNDVFSILLLASHEDGTRLSDREIRDELMTLLIAGHETTANALAWTFDLLLHNPDVLSKARGGDDGYLDAVVKESLRVRPVLGMVGRVVQEKPFQVGEFPIPPGIEINPSIRVMHRRADIYPEPRRFRPERFLGDGAPDTYTWLPFGGGTRRCLGASFAVFEMRVAIRRILERTSLRPASEQMEKVQLRIITLAPRNGTMVVMDQRPNVTRSSTTPSASTIQRTVASATSR